MIYFTRTDFAPMFHTLFDLAGLIPEFLDEANPTPAAMQLHKSYGLGGGWSPFKGFKMDPKTYVLRYPGDPDIKPWLVGKLRDETIVIYPHAWVAVIQPDGTFEISRMD